MLGRLKHNLSHISKGSWHWGIVSDIWGQKPGQLL